MRRLSLLSRPWVALGKYVKFPAKLVSVCTLMGLTSEAMSSPFLKGRGRAAERLGSER